ncbi:MAG TPA: hypothetical protein VIH89_06520 [Candidatus Sulfotelmatobacter sp.]
MPRSRPYKVGLNERLKNPSHTAAYLNAAAKESRSVFMLALRDVAEVHKISKVALAAGVNRETLYRTLSERGNPTYTTLESILDAIGIEQIYRVRVKRGRVAAASIGGTPEMQKAGAVSNVAPHQTQYTGLSRTSAELPVQKYYSGTVITLGPIPALNPENASDSDAIPLEMGRNVPFWINANAPAFKPISVNP